MCRGAATGPPPFDPCSHFSERRRLLRLVSLESLNRLKNVLHHPPLCFPPKYDGHSAKYEEDQHRWATSE
jgi:hypothetical protein